MRLYAMTALLTTLIAAPALAQAPISATTDSGDKVLLYPDGSWKYANPPAAPAPGSKKYFKPATATERLLVRDGRITVNFDPQKWKKDPRLGEQGTCGFTHVKGDGYAKVISERLQIPLSTLKEIAIENAKTVAPDIHVISSEHRSVNGRDVLCMQMGGTLKGIPFVFLGYYYSGPEGTVQLIAFTGASLFDEYRQDFEELLNGFEIVKPASRGGGGTVP